jgi:hypothetical protein
VRVAANTATAERLQTTARPRCANQLLENAMLPSDAEASLPMVLAETYKKVTTTDTSAKRASVAASTATAVLLTITAPFPKAVNQSLVVVQAPYPLQSPVFRVSFKQFPLYGIIQQCPAALLWRLPAYPLLQPQYLAALLQLHLAPLLIQPRPAAQSLMQWYLAALTYRVALQYLDLSLTRDFSFFGLLSAQEDVFSQYK